MSKQMTEQQSAELNKNLTVLTQQLSTKTETGGIAKKFTSRKFILAFVGMVVGILGMIGCNDNTIAVCGFIVLEVLCVIGYLLVEGKADVTGINMIAQVATTITNLVDQLKNTDPDDKIALPSEDESISDDVLPKLDE